MKLKHTKMALTFGEFVVSVYETCGKRKARAKVEREVNAQRVRFLGPRQFLVS